MDKIKITKIFDDAIIPRKREEDGCYDVFARLYDDYMIIAPGEIKKIPTGIASAFPSKYRIGLRERGSTGSKGMSIRAGQIDSGYRGEWFVPINNTTNNYIAIVKEDKVTEVIEAFLKIDDTVKAEIHTTDKAIAQASVEFVPDVEIEEIGFTELKKIPSERGDSCLGSTDK